MYASMLLDRETLDYVALFERYLGPGRRSGREIAFPCWRCDSGQPGKRHLYLNPMTGMYRCYKCMNHPDGAGKGNALHFAQVMGDAILTQPVPAKRYERPNLFDQQVATRVYTYLCNALTLGDEDAAEFLAKRGLRRGPLEFFGIRSCRHVPELLRTHFTDDELIASGLFFRREGSLVAHSSINDTRILIPYPDWETGDIPYIRSRAGRDGDKRKYLSPINNPSGDRIWGRVKEDSTEVVITEGEFKAMAAVQARVLCLALPGMNAAHNAVCRLLNHSPIKKVTICFDTQIDSMENVDHAAEALGRRIRKHVLIPVFRARLPLLESVDGGRKMDIDTFLLHKGREAFLDVLAGAEKI